MWSCTECCAGAQVKELRGALSNKTCEVMRLSAELDEAHRALDLYRVGDGEPPAAPPGGSGAPPGPPGGQEEEMEVAVEAYRQQMCGDRGAPPPRPLGAGEDSEMDGGGAMMGGNEGGGDGGGGAEKCTSHPDAGEICAEIQMEKTTGGVETKPGAVDSKLEGAENKMEDDVKGESGSTKTEAKFSLDETAGGKAAEEKSAKGRDNSSRGDRGSAGGSAGESGSLHQNERRARGRSSDAKKEPQADGLGSGNFDAKVERRNSAEHSSEATKSPRLESEDAKKSVGGADKPAGKNRNKSGKSRGLESA